MTPEQKRELRDILRSVDNHFQRISGAQIPQQKEAHSNLEDEDRDAWRDTLRAIRIIDEVYESHQRVRGSMERAVETLEAKR